MPDIKVKITKKKKTYEFAVPAKFARALDLKAGQSMAIYVDDNTDIDRKICVVLLPEGGSGSLYERETRIVRQAGRYAMLLTIPAKVMAEMELNKGDYLFIRIGEEKGWKYFMLKPDRPTSEILTQDNEDGTTTVNKYKLKPDGSRDMNMPVEKGIVSTETAEKVVKMHETDPTLKLNDVQHDNGLRECADHIVTTNTKHPPDDSWVNEHDIRVDVCNSKTDSVQNEKGDTFNITVTVPKNHSISITLTSNGRSRIAPGPLYVKIF